MANGLITSSLITKTAAALFENNLQFGRNLDWDYEDQFGRKEAQIGDVLSIRKPVQPVVTQGAAFNTQTLSEGKVALAVANHFQVGMEFSDYDLSLRIEEFAERFIEPATNVLAAQVDGFLYQQAIIGTATQSLFNASVPNAAVSNTVGTYGTPITSKTIYKAARYLREMSTPPGMLTGILTPQANEELSGDQIAFYNPNKEISEVYREGELGKFSGANWNVSQSALAGVHTNGAWAGSPVITSATDVTVGWQQNLAITVNGFTAATTINAGDVFTIANCTAVNPLNKKSLGRLAQWVVLSSVASATATNQQLLVAPAIFDPTNGYANVTTAPANGAALTLVGTASTTGGESLLFHKSAFAAASPKFVLPKAVEEAQNKKTKSGINIAYTRTWDAVQYRFITRLDVMVAFAVVTPEWAARIRN